MSAPHTTLSPPAGGGAPFHPMQSYPHQRPQYGPPQYGPPQYGPTYGPPPNNGGWPYMGGDFNPRDPRRDKGPRNKVLAILAAVVVLIGVSAFTIPRLSGTSAPRSSETISAPPTDADAPRAIEAQPVEPGTAKPLDIPLGAYVHEVGLPKVQGKPASVSVEASRAAKDIQLYWKSELQGKSYWTEPWFYYSLDNGNARYNADYSMATCTVTAYVRVAAVCSKSALAWNAQQLTVLQEGYGNDATMLAVGVAYGHFMLVELDYTSADAWNTAVLNGSACMSAITLAEYRGWSGPLSAKDEKVLNAWLSAEGYTGDLAESVRGAFMSGLNSKSYKTCAEYITG